MNRLRQTWADGGQALGGWLQMAGTLHAEALAGCGYDALVIDLQHSMTDFATAATMMALIEKAGAEPIVRVKWNDAGEIMKLLDAGAYGIIVPMIETRAQAEAFAAALHYPPKGVRSYGPRRPTIRYGTDYASVASDTIISFAMVETQRGLDNLDEILAVEGLDGIFIGPTDLSLALGFPPAPDSVEPKVLETIRTIRERTHAAGRRVGIFCASADFARTKLTEGFDFVTATPDLTMLVSTARATIAEMRKGLTP